jgi:beta-galactosidase
MAIVQSTKSAGKITLEATSPGLAPASASVEAKSAGLRPQVAAWEREAPVGPGITGLWRPIPRTEGGGELIALLLGSGNILFALKQDGSSLAGTVEGTGGGFFGGGDVPTPIQDGKVDGPNVSFKAGNATYTGTLNGDQIELQRQFDFGFRLPTPSEPAPGSRPAIGPPPDGSDPSIGTGRFRMPGPLVLHRVER